MAANDRRPIFILKNKTSNQPRTTDANYKLFKVTTMLLSELNTCTMEIYISEEDILQHIQDKFQEAYPHLRLEFFKHPHEAGEGCPRNEKWPLDTPIEDIRMIHSFGWIDISEDRTVVELEKDFYRKIGLSVQVLRQSGGNWLLTTRTDHLTLRIQDGMGAGLL